MMTGGRSVYSKTLITPPIKTISRTTPLIPTYSTALAVEFAWRHSSAQHKHVA
jgi:hypothetical protein